MAGNQTYSCRTPCFELLQIVTGASMSIITAPEGALFPEDRLHVYHADRNYGAVRETNRAPELFGVEPPRN